MRSWKIWLLETGCKVSNTISRSGQSNFGYGTLRSATSLKVFRNSIYFFSNLRFSFFFSRKQKLVSLYPRCDQRVVFSHFNLLANWSITVGMVSEKEDKSRFPPPPDKDCSIQHSNWSESVWDLWRLFERRKTIMKTSSAIIY